MTCIIITICYCRYRTFKKELHDLKSLTIYTENNIQNVSNSPSHDMNSMERVASSSVTSVTKIKPPNNSRPKQKGYIYESDNENPNNKIDTENVMTVSNLFMLEELHRRDTTGTDFNNALASIKLPPNSVVKNNGEGMLPTLSMQPQQQSLDVMKTQQQIDIMQKALENMTKSLSRPNSPMNRNNINNNNNDNKFNDSMDSTDDSRSSSGTTTDSGIILIMY